jgi:subtilisin family serine protease
MIRSLRVPKSFFLLMVAVFLTSTAAEAATSVIVELNGEPTAMAVARARAKQTPMSPEQVEAHRATLAAAQDRFLEDLTRAGVAFTIGGLTVQGVRIDYRYTLVFNGINLHVDPTSIARIESMPAVKKVHPDEMLYTQLDVSVPYIRAQQVYGAIPELTRYDKAGEGYEGQGMYLSVIDTGIEWQHEMFGGDPTPPRLGIEPAVSGRNEKVVYYLPFGDLAVEDGHGHGTHVASTAAGYRGFEPGPDGLPLTGDEIPIHGVAPQARIMAYNVCANIASAVGSLTGAVGGCLSAAITMAIEDSVSPRTVNGFPKPVAHVINMSLGGSGTPDSVSALAADNAVRMGAVVVAAAGNSGPGESTAGAPCVGRLVTCVANSVDPAGSWSLDVLDPSSVNRLLPGAISPAESLRTAANERSGIQLLPMSGSKKPVGGVAQYYVYVLGGETPLSYPASVAGRIAIVQSTLPATFAQIANSAAAAGAVGLVYRTATANPTAVKATIPAANLPPEDFDYLVALMGAGAAPPSGTLSKHPIRLNPFFGQTLMNSTSSRGPVAGFGQVKPDVTGPGTNIMAALPPASLLGVLAQGNYGAISGTSMASPHVAGAAILVRQARPTWTPDMVRAALQNSSTNLRNEHGVPNAEGAQSVIDQGSGLIDVHAAVNLKALMGVTSDDVNRPAILASHSFGIVEAISSRTVVSRTVRVTLLDVAGSAGTYALVVANNRGLEIPGISVTTSAASVSVAANGSATFDVTVTIDGSVVTTGDPLQLQWYVRANRTDGSESLAMPFYLRATRTTPPSATLLPIADDDTPDQENGIDRDGNYVLSWLYPTTDVAQPCGFRVEETQPTSSGTIWYDDAEELMVPLAGNSRWSGDQWTTRPHAGTLSQGYSPIYIDQNTASITSGPIDLPPALITLTFDSFEDIELDFDYGHVDVSDDGGATFTQVATYTGGIFIGERMVDLSAFAGKTIRLRFRLVSDQLVSTPAHQGWTIDNIRVRAGAAFDPIATLPGTARTLPISGKQDGTWAYRVTALFDDCSSNPFEALPSNVEQITVSVATAPPTASFSSDPNPAAVGESITFDASASHDGDSVGGHPGIAQYHWTFGDGMTRTTTSPVTTHAYGAAGTYRVALTVVDDEGESASTESLQTVREPNANISGGGHIVVAGGKANFGIDVVATASQASGNVVWNDHARGVKIKSTRITRVERNGSRATIYGEGTLNKKEAMPFILELADNGHSDDTASMQAGDYRASGPVAGGNINIE